MRPAERLLVDKYLIVDGGVLYLGLLVFAEDDIDALLT
jgi:hypothetical protein